MFDIPFKINQSLKLKEVTRYGSSEVHYYHIYFNDNQQGILIEKHIDDKSVSFKIKPLGFLSGNNILFVHPILYESNKKLQEKFIWFKSLSNKEIEEFIQSRILD